MEKSRFQGEVIFVAANLGKSMNKVLFSLQFVEKQNKIHKENSVDNSLPPVRANIVGERGIDFAH